MKKNKEKVENDISKDLQKKSDSFVKKVRSAMYYKSDLNSNLMSFEWLAQLEFACPYLDNIIRNPKVALVKEEDVVKIEKAKKITVDSVKDLSKHTHFIEEIDEERNEIKPSKILITRNEETYNTYENRFIYTLVANLLRFIIKKEELFDSFEIKEDKTLEYVASTDTGTDRINIQVKIGSKEIPKSGSEDDLAKEIKDIRERIKKIRDYIIGWRRSDFLETLDKMHVSFVVPPIKKTNMILKNPNFQVAMKLWDFIQTYEEENKGDAAEGLDSEGDNILKGILDDAFLMNFFVLDSISASKREQKEKITQYAKIMITQQIKRVVSLLLNSGVKISEEEIFSIIASEIKSEKSKILIGSSDVKNKFKSAIDEYLEKIKGY